MSPASGRPASPAFSRGSSLERDREMSLGPEGSRKVLRIKRLVGSISHFTENCSIYSPSRSMTSGKRKLFAIKLSFARIFVHDRCSRKKLLLLIILRQPAMRTRTSGTRSGTPYFFFSCLAIIRDPTACWLLRLEERIARMKKNQERRLHRKNAKIVKEGGTPMQLSRPLKPDTTVIIHPSCIVLCAYLCSLQRRCGHCGQMGHMST